MLLFGFTGADGKEASSSAGGCAGRFRFYQPQVALPPTADNGLRTRTPRCQSRRRLPLTDPQTTQPGEKNPTKQQPAEPENLNEPELKPPENRAALARCPVRAPSPTDRTPLLPRYGSDVVQRAEPARTGGRTDRAGGEAGGYASHGRFLPTPDCVPRQRPTTGSAQGRRVVNPDDASFLPDPQTAQPGEKKPDQAKPAEPENLNEAGLSHRKTGPPLPEAAVRAPASADLTPSLPPCGVDGGFKERNRRGQEAGRTGAAEKRAGRSADGCASRFRFLPTPGCAPANRRQRAPHKDVALSKPVARFSLTRPAGDDNPGRKPTKQEPAEA